MYIILAAISGLLVGVSAKDYKSFSLGMAAVVIEIIAGALAASK